jgi:hypothetical protein
MSYPHWLNKREAAEDPDPLFNRLGLGIQNYHTRIIGEDQVRCSFRDIDPKEEKA